MRKTIKYFTNEDLYLCAEKAEEWDFNRKICKEQVDYLSPFLHPVIGEVPHEHRRGEECEEHIRCIVGIFPLYHVHPNGRMDLARIGDQYDRLVVDVPLDFYNGLQEREVEYIQDVAPF